jgi:hypothetical protein
MELGLRRPEEKPAPKPKKPPLAKPAPPPRQPREPITWERVWRTLLSERTLRVLLFVGAFLMFASGITMVFNWRRIPAWVMISSITDSIFLSYALGRYMYVRMGLQQSRIALSATGSLLTPVDFYAIYLSSGVFPRAAWAEVWLFASLVCLGVYVITAAALRAEFFGYLVGVAAGSLLCAALQVIGVASDWWSLALCGLALLLLLPSQRWERSSEGALARIFGRPFRHLALLTVTSVLLIVTGLRVARGIAHSPFRLALALDWWLACGVYTIAAARYPRRTLASAACFIAPVALWAVACLLVLLPVGLAALQALW